MRMSRNQLSHFTLRNTRLFACSIKAGGWSLRLSPFCMRKAFSCLATAAGFATVLSSAAVAQQFQDVTLENVTHSAGIETSMNRGRCGFWVDYDNDGRLDLFVKNFEGANRLYRNNGDGTFTQVANAAGLESATSGTDEGFICSFADYDNAYTSIDFVWHRFCSTLGTIIPALNDPHQP